ncbi:MAG: VWA domain-containing protein [Epsilonproteobacteria bacterium]|nr:MAG: VWA domain-containing protein [Campylobacterota bacterium]
MFEGIYFEFPKVASLFFIFLACESLCKMKLPALYFPHTAQFMKQTVSQSKLLLLLKWFGITMLVVALMSPVRDEAVELEPTEGYDIALVLDASQSMSAQGFDPDDRRKNRFDVVQEMVTKFIHERQADSLGVVVFGKYSFIASPLTYDKHIIEGVVGQLYIGMAGKFTALYEAMAQSVNLLSNSKGTSKIAIILTDGHNTPGGKIPLDIAIDLAKKEGVKVYTIGIGTQREYNGALLDHISTETGGKAFGAQTAEQLQAVYKEIDRLEKSEIEREQYSYKQYYYLYPLFLGFFALLGYVYFRNKKGWA